MTAKIRFIKWGRRMAISSSRTPPIGSGKSSRISYGMVPFIKNHTPKFSVKICSLVQAPVHTGFRGPTPPEPVTTGIPEPRCRLCRFVGKQGGVREGRGLHGSPRMPVPQPGFFFSFLFIYTIYTNPGSPRRTGIAARVDSLHRLYTRPTPCTAPRLFGEYLSIRSFNSLRLMVYSRHLLFVSSSPISIFLAGFRSIQR